VQNFNNTKKQAEGMSKETRVGGVERYREVQIESRVDGEKITKMQMTERHTRSAKQAENATTTNKQTNKQTNNNTNENNNETSSVSWKQAQVHNTETAATPRRP
jgi:hypothetical protein